MEELMTKLQPFGNRVALEIMSTEENVGGIIVATPKEKSNKGVVVAVGDGEDVKKISIGDTLIFSIRSGLDYADDTGKYKVLDARDIIGKVIGE
jgi:co-chaperonin GroES (HSP10)